jgi:hypothetical protein
MKKQTDLYPVDFNPDDTVSLRFLRLNWYLCIGAAKC